MPSPVTPILDTFDRPDGSPGANWASAVDAYSVPPIASNALSWPQFPSAYWVPTEFGRSQEAFVTMTGAASAVSLLLRWHPNPEAPGGGAVGGEYGYEILVGFVDPFFVDIERWVDHVRTNVYYANFDMDPTDTSVWARIIDNTIEVYGSDDPAAGWDLRATFTDTSVAAMNWEGFIGVFHPNNGTASALNNFGGGTILTPSLSSPSPPRVGALGGRGI